MNQETKLHNFAVTLAISGINNDADPNALDDFKDVIGMRKHLTLQEIDFENVSQELMIKILVDSLDNRMAKRQMTEEFFEIANAVLSYIEGVRIKVVEVEFSK